MFEQWVTNHFHPGPATRWRRWLVNQGRMIIGEDALRLVVPPTLPHQYSNAQLDDYAGLPRDQYPWRPPLRMTVRARFGQPLLGTAGFGFWNHPFAPQTGIGALPRAIWFFYASSPTDLPIAYGVPGHGWKAATIDTLRPQALRWAPLAPPVVLLNQFPAAYRRVWPRVQRDLQIAESIIDTTPPADWLDYQLEWRHDGARFSVDGKTTLDTDRAPRGPLGFVAWIDNQYAIATPQGRLGWGVMGVQKSQWLDLARIQIEAL
jgi:hypothetical protein